MVRAQTCASTSRKLETRLFKSSYRTFCSNYDIFGNNCATKLICKLFFVTTGPKVKFSLSREAIESDYNPAQLAKKSFFCVWVNLMSLENIV